MFRETLSVSWKASRWMLLLLVVAAFALPLLAVQGTVAPVGEPLGDRWAAALLLDQLGLWLPLFPGLAALTGTLALAVWQWDHRTGHVYALSLPLERWRYALLKLGAGAVLVAVVAAAFWVGALLATGFLELPEGLRAYPTTLAFRFLLTALLFYAILFALAAGSVRTALLVAGSVIVALIAGELVVRFLDGLYPSLQGWSFVGAVFERLSGWPGPFHVLTGNWMLVDV